MTASEDDVNAGQAVYTNRALKLYDFVVLGVSNRFIWKCPTSRLLHHYNQHVTGCHLDVGVGSGYYPDHCRLPANPRIALMDLNPTALDYAAKRIARYKPETYRNNVLDPISLDCDRFDSVAVNYLLHCLPGPLQSKAVVFDHLSPLINSGGRIFGSTLLQGGVRRSWAAKALMRTYNRKGIFSNDADSAEVLESELRRRFDDVTLQIIGCAALFSGRVR